MNIAILGFGAEGRSILTFLKFQRDYHGAEITILDRDETLRAPGGTTTMLGPDYLAHLADFDLVFRSPGAPYNLPEITAARKQGVQFSSTTKLFFERAKGAIIGITGTKGKGTTATLLYNILSAHRSNVYLAGNIGVPAITLLPKLNKKSITILELSSFQLQDLTESPRVAIVLDIFPDHMDAHRDFAEYVEAKSSIAKFQKSTDTIFYSKDNTHARTIAEQSAGQRIAVSPTSFTLFAPYDLRVHGPHMFKNAVMAATVAQHYGVPDATIVATVKKFRGLPYRLTLTRTIRDAKTGSVIQFINDSAGTNPHTAAAAVRSFTTGSLILIAGGKDKGTPFDPFAEAMRDAGNATNILLIGENQNKIFESLSAHSFPMSHVTCHASLQHATTAAHGYAKSLITNHSSLVTILFAPGSASFDQFTSYKDRGKQFDKIVTQLH